MSALQVAGPDGGEAEAEARQWVGGVELDRPAKRLLGPAGVDLGQLGEAQHRLRPRQLRRQLARSLRRPPRPLAMALHQPELGEARPGQRVLRLVLHRLFERLARLLDAEARLLGIGQRDSGAAD